MRKQNYLKLPIDVLNVKEAATLGLTKRQWRAAIIGAIFGIIPFFAVMAVAGVMAGGFAFFICGAGVAFIFAYEKNGITFDMHIKMFIEFRQKPQIRLYKSRNRIERAELQTEKRRLERSLKNGYTYER